MAGREGFPVGHKQAIELLVSPALMQVERVLR